MNEGHEEPDRTSEEVPTGCVASEKGDDRSNGPLEYYEKLLSVKANSACEVGQLINAISTRKGKPLHVFWPSLKDLPMLLTNLKRIYSSFSFSL